MCKKAIFLLLGICVFANSMCVDLCTSCVESADAACEQVNKACSCGNVLEKIKQNNERKLKDKQTLVEKLQGDCSGKKYCTREIYFEDGFFTGIIAKANSSLTPKEKKIFWQLMKNPKLLWSQCQNNRHNVPTKISRKRKSIKLRNCGTSPKEFEYCGGFGASHLQYKGALHGAGHFWHQEIVDCRFKTR